MQTVRELIHSLNLRWKKLDEMMTENDEIAKIAEITAAADDPEDRMMAEEIMQIEEKINFIKMRLRYLDQPVFKEGKLMISKEGRVFIDEKELPDHRIIEFMENEQWHIGFILKYEGGMRIVTHEGKVLIDDPIGIRARIRKDNK